MIQILKDGRSDDRDQDGFRITKITRGFSLNRPSSIFIEKGRTRILCNSTIDDKIPEWNKSSGWLTAEYGMLPTCANNRIKRSEHLKSGRTKEIQRLIGRTLRSALDFELLGLRNILIDCDVLDADGGTRVAAINGGFLALALSMLELREHNLLEKSPIKHQVAAVSIAVKDGMLIPDPDYLEDLNAGVDMNIVMLSDGTYAEVQSSSEKEHLTREELNQALDLAQIGIDKIFAQQREFLKEDLDWILNR